MLESALSNNTPNLAYSLALLGLGGCLVSNPSDINASATDSSSSAGGSMEVSSSDSGTSTDPPLATTSTSTSTSSTGAPEPSSSSATDSGGSGESTESTTSSTTSESSSGGPLGFPNGLLCVDDLECQSQHCFLTGLGGYCSECSDDDDCEAGCSPFGVSGEPDYARCNGGSLGSGCTSAAACTGALTCELVFELPGLLEGFGGCSECSSDADCDGVELCQPVSLPASSVGYRACFEPGARFPGDSCEPGPSGDSACSTGRCTNVSVNGLFTMGVCSDCSNDPIENEGCVAGQTCSDPTVPLAEPGPIQPGICL